MTLEQAVAIASFFTSDSRNFKPGALFVALKGGAHDGHDFVETLLGQKPAAIVVDKSYRQDHPALIKVDDTRLAHRELAALFRKKFKGTVIAVGGSNGKTSTKDFTATLLREKFKLEKTDKSQNGELGIPKTLEKLRPELEIMIVEVGIDAPGDMQRHATLVQPDLAVLTSIGEEHLNLLKTVDNVFQEEKILFDVTLARGGRAIAPAADAYLAKLPAHKSLTLAAAAWPVGFEVPPSINSPHAKQNARLAIEIARSLGMSDDEIRRGLAQLALPEGRGARLQLRADLLIVADHYNANPSSMASGLKVVGELASQEGMPLRLILGDMFDLGSETETAHAKILEELFKIWPSEVLFVGPQMSKLASTARSKIAMVDCAPDSQQAAKKAAEMSRRSGIIFLKGSRGMKLENCLQAIQQENQAG